MQDISKQQQQQHQQQLPSNTVPSSRKMVLLEEERRANNRSRSQPPGPIDLDKMRLGQDGEDVLQLMDKILDDLGNLERGRTRGLAPAISDVEVPSEQLSAPIIEALPPYESEARERGRQQRSSRPRPMAPPQLSTLRAKAIVTLGMVAPAVVFSGPLYKLSGPPLSPGTQGNPAPPPTWRLRHFALVESRLYGFHSSMENEPACMLLDLSWGEVELSIQETPNAEFGIDTIITLKATDTERISNGMGHGRPARHWVLRTSNQADALVWGNLLGRTLRERTVSPPTTDVTPLATARQSSAAGSIALQVPAPILRPPTSKDPRHPSLPQSILITPTSSHSGSLHSAPVFTHQRSSTHPSVGLQHPHRPTSNSPQVSISSRTPSPRPATALIMTPSASHASDAGSDSRPPSVITKKNSIYARLFTRSRPVPQADAAPEETVDDASAAPAAEPALNGIRRGTGSFNIVRHMSKRSRSVGVMGRKAREDDMRPSAWESGEGR
ncbi:hypothetical protein BC829DRAFT_438645 [Chytridium lagenaria]|nr:hypothetical protein BC829DRAFT_438645 [Chytridium lagenaria]